MSKTKKTTTKNNQDLFIDYDGKWKTLIETLFENFVKFFLLEIYDLIDFSIPPIFLKQDTPKILANRRKKGDLVVDNLIKVKLKDGTHKILLLHIEIQGYRYENYGKKMYKTHYRTDDRFEDADVTSFVLYIDDKIPQNHDHYEYQFGKTKIRFDFPVYLIRDQDEEKLLQSDNPFAIAVLVCLKILKIRAKNKGDKNQEYIDRIRVRKDLLELLRQRYGQVNYTEQIIVALVEFIMTVLVVPDKLEAQFEKEFYEPYIIKHQDMELSIQGKRYAEMLVKAHFGSSIEEIMLKWKEAQQRLEEEHRLKEEAQQKLKEEHRLKEEAQQRLEEEHKLKEEAQQKLKEEHKLKEEAQQKLEKEQQKLKEQQNNLIISLHTEADFKVDKIAKFLKIEIAEIQQILKNHQEKQNSTKENIE